MHFKVEEKQANPYESLCAAAIWQISKSHPIYFHICRRPDSDLTISQFMCFCPAYTFMLQFQYVPLEREKKIGIGPLAQSAGTTVQCLCLD